MTTFKKIGSLMAIIAIALVCLVAFSSCVITPDEPACECVDANGDHACDSCGTTLSECADVDKNHLCDECEKALSECADDDNDHFCDYCSAELSQCADADNDHVCDMCGGVASECADNDNDHYCDLCYAPLTDCKIDENKDHKCDICGIVSSQCYDGNKDHVCEYCGGNVGEHADSDISDGHFCNYCGESLCEDGDDEDHNCDLCSANLCADADNNCICDGCNAVLCIDINPLDHNCDNCGKLFSECSDGADSNHDCDVCFKNLCADGDDEDHNCDGCGVNLCVDADNNHYCDGCEKPLCIDSNDRGHTCDVCGESLCADGEDEDHNCDVCNAVMCYDTNEDGKCEVCGNLVPTIIVYVEGANCKINGAEFVHGYGESVDIVPTYHASQYVIDLWIVYDQTGTKIAYIENGVAYTLAGAGTYYIAPIFIANNLSGVGDASTSVDVTDTNSEKINESVITPEWADVNADKKLFIFGSAGHTNNVLASAPNSQVYLTTDPQNAANIVLLHATRNAGTGGIGNTVIETAFDANSSGDAYVMSFDYYFDHNCSNNDSTTTMSVVDENGVEYKIAVIVPKGRSMQNLLDTAEASENAFRFQSRHYNTPGTGITGNDGVDYKDSAGSESMYLYSDTWYTFIIKIEYNVISTYWSLRGSDEITLIQEYDFSNFSISEKVLKSFKINVGLYNNSSIAYFDNVWFGRGHECVDSDNNHNCDVCDTPLCYDGVDADHNCDRCDANLCYEGDIADHYCDVCSATLSECVDENKNHYCDICGKDGMGGECADGEDADHDCDWCGKNFCEDVVPDHKCDVCGVTLSECADNDKDHKCDWCGAIISECADGNNDHKCDVCDATLSECADGDKDHKCDWCGATVSECIDEGKDFICDLCGKTLCNDSNEDHNCDITDEHECVWVKTDCVDADKNHDCDLAGCEEVVGEHADAADDADHVCDHGCGVSMEQCVDNDTNHLCDICEMYNSIWCYSAAGENDDCKCDVCQRTVHTNNTNSTGICSVCGIMTFEGSITEGVNLYTQSGGHQTAFTFGETYAPGSTNGIIGNITADPRDVANNVLKIVVNNNRTNNTGGSSLGGQPTFVISKGADDGGNIHIIEYDFNWATAAKSGWRNPFALEAFDAAGTSLGLVSGAKDDKYCVNMINNGGKFTEGTSVANAYQLGVSGTVTESAGGESLLLDSDTWYRLRYVWNAETGKLHISVSMDGGVTWYRACVERAQLVPSAEVESIKIRFNQFYGHGGTLYFDNISYTVVTEAPEFPANNGIQ